MEIILLLFQILSAAFSMFWDVLWPLLFGFLLSSMIQAVVSKQKVASLLGGNNFSHISLAALFGAASSSCSYAAVALARSLFQKGASFTSSMVFEIASTNLVFELGLILFVLLGWQFVAAEFMGGLLMIGILVLIFRLTLSKKLTHEAHEHAEKGLLGKMEGHAQMDMSVSQKGTFWQRLFSREGLMAISNYFVMDIAAVWVDIVAGLLIAGAIAVIVPPSFWQVFFLKQNAFVSFIIGPLIGPLIAMVSFVCSVGNIPLAVVLWEKGMSFGGIISFIFADLLVVPILHIYKKYYGWRVMVYIFLTFYLTMAATGYIIEGVFSLFHLIPSSQEVAIFSQGISWDYTTWLNLLFGAISFFLVYRFVKGGGSSMLSHMEKPESSMHHHHH